MWESLIQSSFMSDEQAWQFLMRTRFEHEAWDMAKQSITSHLEDGMVRDGVPFDECAQMIRSAIENGFTGRKPFEIADALRIAFNCLRCVHPTTADGATGMHVPKFAFKDVKGEGGASREKKRKSKLEELREMSYYDVLQIPPSATGPQIQKAFRKLAMEHHPDKGGDGEVFKYIKHIVDVLMDEKQREKYDARGRDAFQKACASIVIVQAPAINWDFIQRIGMMKGSDKVSWGTQVLSTVLKKLTSRDQDSYRECNLALAVEMQLRLVPTGEDYPVYCMPRVVRWAALCGTPNREFDLVASHLRQNLKYAKNHNLPRTQLLNFATRESIDRFRNSFNLPASAIKNITNMMAYGNGGVEWMEKWKLDEMPVELRDLKREIGNIIEHMWEHSSDQVKEAVKGRKAPKLTLLSVNSQAGERADLELCMKTFEEMVPEFVPSGYLGDSFLTASEINPKQFSEKMLEKDIVVELKPMPQTEDEYIAAVEELHGTFDRTLKTPRELRREEAKQYAERYIFGSGMSHCPDQEIVIAIEDKLPIYNNHLTGKTEYFDSRTGRWNPTGGDAMIKGEDMSIPLIQTFRKTEWKLEDLGHKNKLMPVDVPFDDSRFRNNTWLANLVPQAKALKHSTVLEPLDSSKSALYIRNFTDGWCLDFNIKSTDPDVATRLMAPLRQSRKEDRISRHCPTGFVPYTSPHRWELVKVLQLIEDEFKAAEKPDDDAVVLLSEEIKEKLEEISEHHPCLRKIFYEAFNDWDEAIALLRAVMFAVIGRANQNMEHFTCTDSGDGSTGKGTLRALVEAALGPYNGVEQRGYSSVMSLDAVGVHKGGVERPQEQWANLRGSCITFIDDFKADAQNPLSNSKIRQITGMNNLTAARKNREENIFCFHGLLMLMVNGFWVGDHPAIGADLRRVSGADFAVSFQNAPVGPMQRQKDATIKLKISNMLPEFWFLAMAYQSIDLAFPNTDFTCPRPPSSVPIRKNVADTSLLKDHTAMIADFVNTHMVEYVLAEKLPDGMNEIDRLCMAFFSAAKIMIQKEEVREHMKKHFHPKTAHSIPKFAGRKKTTSNVYLKHVSGGWTVPMVYRDAPAA